MPNMFYELIIILIGWLYPAFATYNSLNGSLRSQVIWMKYWIVFGAFNAFHFVTYCLDPWVPFLIGFKLFVLCWLLPNLGNGSQFIHDDLLDPLLRRNKESINQTLNSICQISSILLREVIKMIYHLLVDVIEQCWLMTRNANDIHVTPRLQVAINEVIAEIHTARQAAIFMHSPLQQANKEDRLEENTANHYMPVVSAVPTYAPPVTVEEAKCEVEEEDYEEVREAKHEEEEQKTGIDVEEIPIKTTDGAFRAAALSYMTDDTLYLRILLAEALSAQRMQLGQLLAGHEHLVPINTQPNIVTTAVTPSNKPQCPSKPIRGMRTEQEANAAEQQQYELDLEIDRAFSEYCSKQESL